MLKRMLLLLVLVSVVGTAVPDAQTAAPAAQRSKASDLLKPPQVKALIANAKTPADHVKRPPPVSIGVDDSAGDVPLPDRNARPISEST